MKKVYPLIAVIGAVLFSKSVNAQVLYYPDITKDNFDGIRLYDNDSTFGLNFRFRMQNRAGMRFDDNFTFNTAEWYIRRLRLRFNGFVWSKKLTYMFQLGFSAGDQSFEAALPPNIIRDAFITYKFNKRWSVGIGQAKLPGNRQRVISSGEQQFSDRSIVNSNFTIDRDFGVQIQYSNKLFNKMPLRLRGALSSGAGRNYYNNNDGFCYTVRGELLPFGEFTMNGDYFEGDWAYEKKPKLSIGGVYSFNNRSLRAGGQLGAFLAQPRNIQTSFVDMVLKYKGWALSSEYAYRFSPEPITIAGGNKVVAVYNGWGVNTQLSKQFKSHYELAFRQAYIEPLGMARGVQNTQNEQTIALVRYLSFHRVKIQTEATRLNVKLPNQTSFNPTWIFRLQVELGI